MASKPLVPTETRARFRFKAEIYDTYKNEDNVTFYVLTVQIYGLNIDEYEIKKRFSQFAEFDSRLKARFHHKRLPQLPSKTLTKSAKHDDMFIARRKTALNRYLRGIGQRLYLQNCESIWQFFDLIDKINPYLNRYRVVHLKSIQCNDYQLVDPPLPTKGSRFSLSSLFSSKQSNNKTIVREWRAIYGAFIAPNIYLSVSTIHADHTKNNWWDSFMSTASDAKAYIATNTTTPHEQSTIASRDEFDEEDRIEKQPPRNDNSLGSLESIDFDASSQISDMNAHSNALKHPKKETDDEEKDKGLSAWEAEKLASAENEFYLGKIEIFQWNEADADAGGGDTEEVIDRIMYRSHCRFPLVRNRPSCALFLSDDDLLLVGTSHGKILCFKLNRCTWTLSHICYLPRVFGSYVTDMVAVACDKIYYRPVALSMRKENPLPRGSDKTADIGTSFIYAVSADCHLSVFDLRSGDCIGHIQTGITGNLSIAYCCEKLFISNRNNIVVFIRSSATGDPVPHTELIGHSTTVYCLHADEYNKRLFSGSGDNSVAVWYYDKVQDTMLQVQQLKSVNKSSKFTCVATASNISCVIAGADNGFITIWHECDDELSDKMYDMYHRDDKRHSMQNGSVASKKSCHTNMVWKCVYTWKAHKGKINTIKYNEEYNMLMSTSDGGQIRLVYLCDPGQVPPMQMMHQKTTHKIHWPECLKDKLNKTFNEIQEIELNNYPNTQYCVHKTINTQYDEDELKDEEELMNDDENAIHGDHVKDNNTKEEEEEEATQMPLRYSNTSLNELL
eukprot:184150_1